MTIQRQYSLPNCTLVLEGLGDMTAATAIDPRPLMSILINAECHLPGQDKPLTGGREFLESLIAAVSRYTQFFLSGIAASGTATGEQGVQLQQVSDNQHRLLVRPTDVPPDTGIAAHLSREVDLTTVQLFDLVEALDQFLADTRTLPDLKLNLAPVSKRHVGPTASIAKQMVPAAIGASGLAAATLAFSLLPTPQVKQPQDLFPKPATVSTTGTPAPATPPTASPGSPASPSPSASVLASPSPTTTPSLADLEATLATAPEISDPAAIDRLRQQLYTQLDSEWVTRTPVTQDLVYRVGVAEDGKIVGYKPVNPAALDESKKTPLLDLLTLPPNRPATDPIAQYKVVFTGTGGLEVAPWKQVMESPVNSNPEITDSQQLEAILPKLRSQLLDNWKTDRLNYDRGLEYRVRVKPDGTIVDYRPEDQAATDYLQETPLSRLGKLAEANPTEIPDSYALFRVVFTPAGQVEISPWRGWK